MSETVFYSGRAVELDLDGMTQIEFLKKYAKENHIKVDYDISNYDLYDLLVSYGLWGSIVPVNDGFYKILDKNNVYDEDIFEANKRDDGRIDFKLKYYNGGCSFSEALEEAVNNMESNTGE